MTNQIVVFSFNVWKKVISNYIYVKNQMKLLKIIKCSNDKSVVYNWTNNMNEICDIVLLDSWQNI